MQPTPHIMKSDVQEEPVGRFFLDDSMFKTDREGIPVPNFKIKEVAKTFFGQNDEWLRWLFRKHVGRFPDGRIILDGEPLPIKRSSHNIRLFTLADIEKVAHALTQAGIIDGLQLMDTIKIIRQVALKYGVGTEEYHEQVYRQRFAETVAKTMTDQIQAAVKEAMGPSS